MYLAWKVKYARQKNHSLFCVSAFFKFAVSKQCFKYIILTLKWENNIHRLSAHSKHKQMLLNYVALIVSFLLKSRSMQTSLEYHSWKLVLRMLPMLNRPSWPWLQKSRTEWAQSQLHRTVNQVSRSTQAHLSMQTKVAAVSVCFIELILLLFWFIPLLSLF